MLRRISRIAYALPVLILLSCRPPAPADLRLESVETVKLSDLSNAWGAVQLRRDAKSDEIQLLKINFSSKHDLLDLAKTNTLHLSYRAYTCDKSGEEAALFVLSDLRIGDISAGGGVSAKISDLERFRSQGGRLTYHVLVPLAGDELTRIFGGVSVPDHIPFLNPRLLHGDICLQMTAAGMSPGSVLRSNVVRVPTLEVARVAK
jgi:hypothetical protein